MIYDRFKAAIRGGVLETKAGILADEQFIAAILTDARGRGYTSGEERVKPSSILSTEITLPNTSKRCSRRSAPFWCATTRKGTGSSMIGKFADCTLLSNLSDDRFSLDALIRRNRG